MAYYSDELIEEVLASTDIVELVGEYVQLRRRGSNYIGLCPFHREKTPSFTVAGDKQICKCFGCSEGGTAIQFIMKIENLDFRETLEFLAERAGIDVSKYDVSAKGNFLSKDSKDEKETMFKLNKDAAKYFYEALSENVVKEGSILKQYLEKRHLTGATVAKFGLGFGNKEKIGLFKHLTDLGYTRDEIIKAGVVTVNAKGDIYENFKGRLIFPILDTRDRVIGFGGRVLDNSLPKYVNSPENLIYHKGRNLYGLNNAKKENLDYCIMVEGYMDTVALYSNGVGNVVASLGTALTENQAKLLRKYTETVVIAYDQDSAGKAATKRAIDILYKQGLKVKVLKLDHEEVKDPDEYINKYGTERFLNCVKKSSEHIEYKIEELKKSITGDSTSEKIDFLNSAANILAGLENNIEREMYISKIAEDYKISKGILLAEVEKKLKVSNSETVYTNIDISQLQVRREKALDIRRRQEMYIISLMLIKDRKIFNGVKENFTEKDFNNQDLGDMFNMLLDIDKEKDITKSNIISRIKGGENIKLLTEVLYVDIKSFDKEKLLEDLVKSFTKFRYIKRREEIDDKLSDKNIDEDEKEMLEIEVSQIIKKMAKI